MIINYILNLTTLEELKKEYKRLAMIHHPDLDGGNLEIMKQINNEYDYLFPLLKDKHINAQGEQYTKESTETPEEWKDIINALINLNMQGVTIEIIGSFVWVTGNTKPYKDALKAMGYRWSSNKFAWYLAPNGYKKRNKLVFDMNDIRNMYGTQTVNTARENYVALMA